jgi:hypothetical protein
VEPTIITDEGSIVLRLQEGDAETSVVDLVTIHKDQISQRFLKSTVEKSLDNESTPDTDGETDDESEDEAETKYNKFVSHIPQALRDHMPDFYLKPLFRAKGINFGTLRPKDEEPEDDSSESNDESQQQTRQIATTEVPKQKKSRAWVPKVFRRKQPSTQEVGPYF